MSVINVGLLPAVSSVAGTPGQITVNGGYAPANGAVVIALDGALTGATGIYNTIYGGDTNLSGSLVSMSGQLVTQIQSAAGVLSLNNATGLLTLTSAPANANYVKVSTSGTTIYISGDSVPLLSGVLLAGGARVSGNLGSVYLTPASNGVINSLGYVAAGNVGSPNVGTSAFFDVANTNTYGRFGVYNFASGVWLPVTINEGGGVVMVNTSTNSLNGALQLATHTTSGGGIGLGPDNSVWRLAANSLRTDSAVALKPAQTNVQSLTFFNTNYGLGMDSADLVLWGANSQGVSIKTNSTANGYDGAYIARFVSGAAIFGGGVSSQTNQQNGVIQTATHTTSGGGLGLGPDNSIWRTAANAVSTNAAFTSTASFNAPSIFANSTTIQLLGSSNDIRVSNGRQFDLTFDALTLKWRDNSAGQDMWNYVAGTGHTFQVGGTTALSLFTSGAYFASGIYFRDTGNYTASGAASVAQLLAASGWLTNSSTSNVVYTTGDQNITGQKTFNQSGVWGATMIANNARGAILTVRAGANTEAGGAGYNDATPSHGVSFQRYWNGATPSDFGGIYSYGAAGWGGGMALYTKPSDGLSTGAAIQRMLIEPGGNASLGLSPGTAASAKLHVSGDLRVATSASFAAVAGSVGIGTTTPGALLHVAGGNIYTSGTSNVSNTIDCGVSSAGVLQYAANGAVKGRVYWSTTSTGLIAQGTVAADGAGLIVTAANNVGIGLTNPSDVLVVSGSTDGVKGARIVNGNGGTSAYSTLYLGTAAAETDMVVFVNGTGNTATYGGARAGGIGTNAATPLVFITNGTEKARITSAGLMGIGITNPATTLSVSGTLTLDRLLNANQAAVRFNLNGANKWFLGQDSNSQFQLYSYDLNDYAMTVTTTGRVGIGTTTPAERLHVSGGSLRVDGSGLFGGTTPRVGIGTLTPGYALNVFDGATEVMQLSSTKAAFNKIGDIGGSLTVTIAGTDRWSYNAGAFSSSSSNTNASVGIGVGTPLAPLHVTGLIRTDTALSFSGLAGVSGDNAGAVWLQPSGTASVNLNLANSTMRMANFGGSATLISNTVGGKTLALGNSTAGLVQVIASDATVTMTCTDSKTVGIGVVTPAERLQVSGGNLRVDGRGLFGIDHSAAAAPLGIVDVQAGLHATAPSGIVVRRNASQYISIHEVDGSAHAIEAIGDKTFRINNYATSSAIDAFWFGYNNGALRAMTINSSGAVGIGVSAGLGAAGNLTLGSGLILGQSNVTGGGVAFYDTNLYRLQPGYLFLNAASGSQANLSLAVAGAEKMNYYVDSSQGIFGTVANLPLIIRTNSVAAMTIGTDRVVTHASGIILGASNVTGGGIAFGPDTYLQRTAASTLTVGAAGAGAILRVVGNVGGQAFTFSEQAGNIMQVASSANLRLQSNAGGTIDFQPSTTGPSVVFDSGKNAQFYSGIFFADTGNYTRSGVASVAQLLAVSGGLSTITVTGSGPVQAPNFIAIGGGTVTLSGVNTVVISGGGGGGGTIITGGFYSGSYINFDFRSNIALTPGVSSQVIPFSATFPFVPFVTTQLSNSAGDPFLGSYIAGTPTTTGFTIAFSSNVPTSNYTLSYTATSGAGYVQLGGGNTGSSNLGAIIYLANTFI